MSADIALDGMLESLSRCLDDESARRLMAMQFTDQVRQRIDQLAEAANEGALAENEQSEYEALMNAADFVSILKLKARQQLHASPE
jgi:hypothetical protein